MRGTAAVASAVLLLAGGLGTSAAAQDAEEPDVTVYHGLTASPGFEEFDGCPVITGPDAVGPALCLRLDVGGPLNLGDVDADIEPPMSMVIGLRAGNEGSVLNPEVKPPVVVVAQGEPGEPQKLEGGLLGVPELDALLNPVDALTESVVGAPVWGVYADADIADPDAQIDELVELTATFTFVASILGIGPDEEFDVVDYFAMFGGDAKELIGEQTIGLPVSIHVQNLLLGDNCYIGTPDDRININLTTGVTDAPEGVDPMEGGYGSISYSVPDPNRPGATLSRIRGASFVDNTFAVPGASGCDAVVGGLLGQPQGLLDSVINGQTGLPSAAGNNVADFNIDFAIAMTNDVYRPLWTGTPNPTDFGEVPVGGSSAPETIVIENTGDRPTHFGNPMFWAHPGVGNASPYFAVDVNTCTGQTLLVGDTCHLEVRGTPPAAQTMTGRLDWTGSAGGGDGAGNATEPVLLIVTGTS